MAKSENLKDKTMYKVVAREIKEFQELIKGYEKLLYAIGKI